MQGIKDNPNLPLIVTILLTVLLLVGGIVVLSKNEKKPLPEGEKEQRLVRDDSNIAGLEDSKGVFVEFSDFQCPACANIYPETKKVQETYSDRVKFVYRHYPLESIHPLAQTAAEASEAAAVQDKFWEFHDKLFESQVEWSSLSKEQAKEKFADYAKEIGITDLEKFKTELDNGTYTDKVNRDQEDGDVLDIAGTPTIFINGEQVSTTSYEGMSEIIEEELNK